MGELARLLRYVRSYAAILAVSVLLMAVVCLCQAAVVVLIDPVIDRILSPEPVSAPVELFTLPFSEKAIYLADLLPASTRGSSSFRCVSIFSAASLALTLCPGGYIGYIMRGERKEGA